MRHKHGKAEGKAPSRLLWALAAIAALGGPSHAETLAGLRIGISIGGTDLRWDARILAAMQQEIVRLGGEPILRDAGRSDQVQAADVQALATMNPDAISVLLGNPAALDPAFRSLAETGIPIFTVSMPHPVVTSNTTANSQVNATRLAQRMVQDLRGRGRVLAFNGFYDVPTCRVRYDMMAYVLEEFSDVSLASSALIDVMPDTVQQAFDDVTGRLAEDDAAEIRAIWGCWDTPLIGAVRAIEAAGREDINVYGFGGSPDILRILRDTPDAPIGAIVALDPEAVGIAHVHVMARSLAGAVVPPFTYVDGVLLDAGNIDTEGMAFLPE